MPNNKMRRSESVTPSTESAINSPLARFGRAKKRINQIFGEALGYLKESRLYLIEGDISEKSNLDSRKEISTVDGFLNQVAGINQVLRRDHMKVAFFGRTSNGKSTVVNAMLSDRILPMGIGHTTNCFVSVVGADGCDAYMCDTCEENSERRSVESLQQLANALHDERLDSSSLLQVHWPKVRCSLLKDDVVFVDSPGIDVTPDLDVWIDKHCQDADVFVLVVNSESTINHTEKSFFHKVNEKLSKPNIFILNNRWDASADDEPDTIQLVRQQHEQRATEFLVEDLKCVTRDDASDRIFFVSALETLRHRIAAKRNAAAAPGADAPVRQASVDEAEDEFELGKIRRRQEFEDFELKFKECISKSAIVTKFNGHTVTGLHIAEEMSGIMEQVLARASSQKQWCKAEYQDMQETLDFMTTKFKEVSEIILTKVRAIGNEVEAQVTTAISDEIRRLSHLVDDFDFPFHPHPGFLRNYKKELHLHIEKGLGKNLKARCSAPLIESIEGYKSDMQDQVFALIPASACTSAITASPKSSFMVTYELDVPNLCSGFQEDISFKFSLGWSALVSKFVAPRNPRLAILLGAAVKYGSSVVAQQLPPSVPTRSLSLHGEVPGGGQLQQVSTPSEEQMMIDSLVRYDDGDDPMVLVVESITNLGSPVAVGTVATLGLLWKLLGLKVIGIGAACYTAIYIYERTMWTNGAKERVFKQQFAEYSRAELQRIVSFTSKSCSRQIEQELSATFAQLESQVEMAKQKLEFELNEMSQEVIRLQDIENNAKVFRNKSTWLFNELTMFMKEFGIVESSTV